MVFISKLYSIWFLFIIYTYLSPICLFIEQSNFLTVSEALEIEIWDWAA